MSPLLGTTSSSVSSPLKTLVRPPIGTAEAAAAASTLSLKMASSAEDKEGGFLQGLLGGIFKKEEDTIKEEKPKLPDVVVTPDYNLSIFFCALGIIFLLTSPDKSCVDGQILCPPSIFGAVKGGLSVLFASFLAIQANRIRFVFDENAFELKNVDLLKGESSEDEDLKSSGENFVVGGANRWNYDSFVNWDFFPSEKYPVLVYFKETQTPKESWNEGPGQLDKVGGGQIHFFPAIASVPELKEQFTLRGCAKKE